MVMGFEVTEAASSAAASRGWVRRDLGWKSRTVILSKALCFAGGRIVGLHGWGFSQNCLLNQPDCAWQERALALTVVIDDFGLDLYVYSDESLLSMTASLLDYWNHHKNAACRFFVQ
jgi:hypothetical protein